MRDPDTPVIDLPGIVVSGHPDRHVVQVVWQGRTAWLKREHRIRRRDRRESRFYGFGSVGKSLREAAMLRELAQLGYHVPEVIDAGEVDRRGWLLLADLPPAVDLVSFLRGERDPALRRRVLTLVVELVRRLHRDGVVQPDLAAKHIRVREDRQTLDVIDWQRAYRLPAPNERECLRTVAILAATLPDDALTRRERLRLLAAIGSASRVALGPMVAKLRLRSSIREQLRVDPVSPRKLVWLEPDEGCCAVPEVAEILADASVRDRLYEGGVPPSVPGGIVEVGSYPLRSAYGLHRRWRAPQMHAARLLFHLHRHGIAAPDPLAFGRRGWKSFVWYTPPVGIDDASEVETVAWLEALHEAGCALTGKPLRLIRTAAGIAVARIDAIEYVRRVSPERCRRDTRRLSETFASPPSR